MLHKAWTAVQDFLDSIAGGQKVDSSWGPDESLREAIAQHKMLSGDNKDIQGALFLSDLEEFLGELDAYNDRQKSSSQKFRLVVREENPGQLATDLLGQRMAVFGVTAVGGLGLERGGRVYPGRYFNDLVYNTGFVFRSHAVEGKFLCGLEKKARFDNVASALLHNPVYGVVPLCH